MTTLRQYQTNDLAGIRSQFATGARSVLHVLPPGAGKTVEFSEMVRLATEKGKRSVILAHRDQLISQASEKLKACGVNHGIIAPGHGNYGNSVNVASVMTMVRRLGQYEFDFIVVDEAHHSVSPSYKKILDHYPKAKILGVTASPCRLNGQGLGSIFQKIHIGPKFSQLISEGFLSDPITYGPSKKLDLSGIKTSGGDWDREELADYIDKPRITGDAVEHYSKICPGVAAIVYCVNIRHAEDVSASFSAAGYRSVSVHGKLPIKTIRERISGLGDGSVQVLTSCEILSEGVDAPHVICVIGLRPTKSLGLHIQQLSRGLRPIFAPGHDLGTRAGRLAAIASGPKPHAFLLDHAANSFRFGLVEDDREWTLEGKKKRGGKGGTSITLTQCPQCLRPHKPSPKCPYCGYVRVVDPREPETAAGTLEKIDKDALRRAKRQEEGSCKTFEDLQKLGKARGYLSGWARIKWGLRMSRKGQAQADIFG